MTYNKHFRETLPLSKVTVGARTRTDMGDLNALAASIKTLGLLQPVLVDSRFRLIAGARRFEAIKSLGWKDVPVTVAKNLDDAVLALKAERDENTQRKDFTPSEAVAVGEKLWALERPKAEERQRKGGESGGKASGKLPEACAVVTRDLVGSAVGMSGRSFEKAKAVVEAARSQPEKYADLPSLMDKDGKVDRAFRELRRREAVKKVADAPKDKFRVIYADPPWKYGDTRNGLEGTTGAEAHYPTMSIAELCALPVRDWADSDAVLFLWVTSPLLFQCAPVIEAWGFEYKASFVWDKVKHNLGHYNSVRHEFLLICTRGSCTPDNVKLFDSVQSIERSEKHSQKPKAFREIIETLYPHGKRLEMFAREKTKGWATWGNES